MLRLQRDLALLLFLRSSHKPPIVSFSCHPCWSDLGLTVKTSLLGISSARSSSSSFFTSASVIFLSAPFVSNKEVSSFSMDGLQTSMERRTSACDTMRVCKTSSPFSGSNQLFDHGDGIQHHASNFLIIFHGLNHLLLYQTLDPLFLGPCILFFLLKTW